ncbi:MAG: potassium channel family protein [Myxococcota bacterium]
MAQPDDTASRVADFALMALVALNVIAVVMESVDAAMERYALVFFVFELLSVSVFSAEYLLRIWSVADSRNPRFAHLSPNQRRLRWAFSPLALADLLAILPFYLQAFVAIDLRFLRTLRLLRVLKLTRYSPAMGMILDVLRHERHSFSTAFFLMCTLLILVAAGIHLAEHQAQPEAFGSIPAAMWWSVVTLTTVGYGDVTPVTTLGKIFAASVSIVGVCLVALPTSIMASGFANAHRRRQERLESHADIAVADGYLSPEESRDFMDLAERLGVEPDSAITMVEAAWQRRETRSLPDACPHCGKRPGE